MGSAERMLLALRMEEGTESSGMWGPQFETGPCEEGLDRMGAWACSEREESEHLASHTCAGGSLEETWGPRGPAVSGMMTLGLFLI